MNIEPRDFLDKYFGKEIACKYDCYEDGAYEGARWSGDLEEILCIFKDLLLAEHIAQHKNPRSGKYTIIDTNKGIVLCHLDKKI